MKIKTEHGTAEAMPLSDIQTYNISLKQNTKAIYIIGMLFFGLIIFLLLYIHYYNVWGNTIRTIGGC